MSQLQSVLRRSVAHLDPSDHDGRNRVFVNAREAMIRLLWSYDPPLSPKEIDAKIDEFDDIVTQILDEEPGEDAGEDGDTPDDADTDEPNVIPEREEPAISQALEPLAMSARRAEALAILRRPARFEPVLQIGSPTPLAAPNKAPGSDDAVTSALLAKQAVDQALARLNGRLPPVADEEADEDDRPVTDDEIPDLSDDDVEQDAVEQDVLEQDEFEPEDVEETDIPDAEDEADADEPAPEDEPDENDGAEDRDHDPDGFDDTNDPDHAYDGAVEPDEGYDAEDDPDADNEDDADLRTEVQSRLDRAASRRPIDDDHDYPVHALDDEEDTRLGWRERLGDAVGGINGKIVGAVAAVVILLAGGLLGATYFLGRSDAPQMAAAPEPAPAQPAAPETSAPSQPAPAAAAEPAQQPAAMPSGGLALETLSLFDGRDPSVFQSAPDNPIRFEGDTLGGFARISSSPNGAGSRINVGRGVFERLAGRTVRIVVVARAAATDPATSLRFSYQNGRGLSPWQDGALGTDYAPLSLTWTVPKERGGPETDAVMIEPGIPGDGTAADVSSVRIEILK